PLGLRNVPSPCEFVINPCYSLSPVFISYLTHLTFGSSPLSLRNVPSPCEFVINPCYGLSPIFYNTSGANDNIFIYSFSLSFLATGPKIRVPLGVLSSLISTAAFSSNLIYDPSGLSKPFFDLTI